VDGSSDTRGCGWYVDIWHAGGLMTRYCHMVQRPNVSAGQQVAAGQPIGLSGSSGNSSGPHLHFEVHINGDHTGAGAIDPERFMREVGAPLGDGAQ
jgi:murein DD-endopeptidase MepM/ murein hydrolase activator NlpD